MKVLDYALFIIHRFLVILKRVNNKDIEDRSKNGLTLIIFLYSMLLFSVIYGTSISKKIISYNKFIVIGAGIIIFILARYLIFKRYKTAYYKVIEVLNGQFSYSNKKIIFLFLILWFSALFFLWIGVIIVRKCIY